MAERYDWRARYDEIMRDHYKMTTYDPIPLWSYKQNAYRRLLDEYETELKARHVLHGAMDDAISKLDLPQNPAKGVTKETADE